jgi:cyanophycinase-like exopeptidase
MSALPRLLVLMGSGETSPTMVKTHRSLRDRVGGAPAVLLDTPFGFQANADDLVARARAYFRESVGTDLELATFRSADEVGSVSYERTLSLLRSAGYVFAGPGSPTYALSQWRDSAIPGLLRSKLESGGCVTFASAAALTMGVVTVPVYEIYKVGALPEWAPGLDLLSATGLSAAVIPHYNNAEGGNHDTRFCYLGEPRLALLERSLPEDAFVLGVDEHTGVVLDLDARTATVVGNSTLTVRAGGRSAAFEAGTVLGFDEIASTAASLRADSPPDGVQPASRAGSGDAGSDVASTVPVSDGSSPLRSTIDALSSSFDAALSARDVEAAAQCVLDLEQALHDWAADTLQSDDVDHGRAALRSMVTRLAALAETGAADPRSVVGGFVDALLDLRRGARADKRFADADAVRDALVALGVEVRDTPAGTEWSLGRSGEGG